MRSLRIYCLFVILLCGINIQGQNVYKELQELYEKSYGNEDSIGYRIKYFAAFPKSHNEFIQVFHNSESPLYSKSREHVYELFASTREVVGDTAFMRKLIALSLGGSYDADAVFMLRSVVGVQFYKNPILLAYLLKQHTSAEIRSIIYFWIDGMTMRFDEFPKPLESIKEYDEYIYMLIRSTYDIVEKDINYKLDLLNK